MAEKTDYRKFYYVFGIPTTVSGSQLIAECPFCDKSEHFYIDRDSGQFMCHSGACAKTGNSFVFIRLLYERLLKDRPSDNGYYQKLSENRGLKNETLASFGIIRDGDNGWYLPTRNQKGEIVNLYRAVYNKDGKLIILSSPAPCTQHLYGVETIKKHHERIYVVEGHWDRIALVEILAHLRPYEGGYKLKGRPDYDSPLFQRDAVLAVPGAGIFKSTWLQYLKDKEVVLIYDNDKSGREGVDKLVETIRESSTRPSMLSKVIWENTDSNDIRDLLVKDKLSYLSAFERLQERTFEISLENALDTKKDYSLDALECHSFKHLIERLSFDGKTRTGLHMTEDIKITFALMLATILSTPTRGGQIGLRVIGPASSAKSTLAECCSQGTEFVYPRDTFTGIISGSTRESNMMASKINGHCVIVKEADTLMQLPNLSQIMSELRSGLGDGVVRGEYRNGRDAIEIYCLFTMIMCGTNNLRDMDNTQLGSRFVDIEIRPSVDDEEKILDSSFESAFHGISQQLDGSADEYDESSRKAVVMRTAPYVNGFLQYKAELLANNSETTPCTPTQKSRLKALAALLAYTRATVSRDKAGNIRRRVDKELPARIMELLVRLSIFLSHVIYNNKKIRITNQVIEIVRRVVQDTSAGFVYDIIAALYKHKTLSTERLGEHLGITTTHIRTITADMRELKILETTSSKMTAGRGRMAHCHTLTPKLQAICKNALKRKEQ